MKFYRIALGLIAALALCTACDDDGNDNNDNNNNINNQTKWIGSSCDCEGLGCEVASIPLPLPQNNEKVSGKIINCDNIDMTGIEGGEVVCVRSIDPDYKAMAPITYFPQGYCSVAAVSCEGSSFCFAANYGDPSKMTKCPAGSVMISTVFDYDIMMQPAVIVEKMCTKRCETDDDCNKAGEISCIERKGHKFCYHEKNFEFLGDPEKINYIDF